MKKHFLMFTAVVATMTVSAQSLPADVIRLTDENVTIKVEAGTCNVKYDNLVIAGDSVNGYKGFFTAETADAGIELWVTDGTKEGTHMVKDINPGEAGSEIHFITRFNDKVVFSANDGEYGSEPWISDGTEAGTHMVADVHILEGSEPRGFCQMDEGHFVFAAKDFDSYEYKDICGKYEHWLWISDGTEQGTHLVKECDVRYPGKYDSDTPNGPFIRVGRKVFFKADTKDGFYGEELWITDGTSDGTRMVKDINIELADAENPDKGTADNALNFFVNFYNEKLYFDAFSDDHGHEAWASDGTEQGTYEIFNAGTAFTPVIAGSGVNRDVDGQLSFPCIYNGRIFNRTRVTNDSKGTELYATDLTQGNLTLIHDGNTITINDDDGMMNSWPDVFCEYDGCLWFVCQTGSYADGGYELEMMRYDGNQVTMPFGDFNPTGHGCVRTGFEIVGGCLYFSAMSDGGFTKVYRIDNKDQKVPTLVANLTGSFQTDDGIHTFRNCRGTMLFCSTTTGAIYACNYKKAGYQETWDNQALEIEYRTRQEIADGVGPHEGYHPDGLEDILAAPTTKVIKKFYEGRLYIIRNGVIVDALGQRVN